MYREYDMLKDLGAELYFAGYESISERVFALALAWETAHWRRKDIQHAIGHKIISIITGA